jgi:hypothetical protein
MSREGTPHSKHKSLESLSQTFKTRLDVIWNKELSIENIETFADEALEESIKLTDDILTEYRRNSNVKASPTTLDTQAQENEAFAILGLPNINEILDQINKVKDSINSLKDYIHTNVEKVNVVITPPQPDQAPNIEKSNGGFEKKKMFPRLLTLLYILEHDFEITPTPENVPIKEGVVTPEMMRRTPYVRAEIPELERAVYICDEEENASYVFDTAKLAEAKLTLDEIDIDDKGDKNSLIAYHPGIGIRLVQSPKWRSRMAGALREKIPRIETIIPQEHERQERSEFEKPKWLPFEEFREDVRALYPGKGNLQKWYSKEIKKHNNWPSNPHRVYKNKGWKNWWEVVNRWLSFTDLQNEVTDLYLKQKPKNVIAWYREEQKKHKNWPVAPYRTYKEQGWKDWRNLAGKENKRRKEFLSFENFRNEIRASYPGRGDIGDWYNSIKKDHPNWPGAPHKYYENEGWKGWPTLVGRKKEEE